MFRTESAKPKNFFGRKGAEWRENFSRVFRPDNGKPNLGFTLYGGTAIAFGRVGEPNFQPSECLKALVYFNIDPCVARAIS